jgi:hypothetical protein
MVENFGEIWSKGDWTREARLLIEGIQKLSDVPNLIMFLRHSHRDHISNVEQMANLGLTKQGKEIAILFGKGLPKDKTIHLFYSVVARCKETAESILNGFKQAGGEGKLIGPLEALFHVDGERNYIIEQIFLNPEKELINRWAAGHFSSEKIQPLNIYAQKTAKTVFKLAREAPPNNIDIHVTHDLQVMALRFSWFGIDPCNYWVSYLGGFIIPLNNSRIKFCEKGRIIECKPPHWWKEL